MKKKFDFDIGLADDDADLDADLTKQIENIELNQGGWKPAGNHDTRIQSVVSEIQDNPYDINARDSMARVDSLPSSVVRGMS